MEPTDATDLKSLRFRVAAALFAEGVLKETSFYEMGPLKQKPWLDDADRIIPLVVEACAKIADQRDPEKPNSFLFRREQIANVMRGLYCNLPDWECPIGVEDCFENCGNYGCGN